MFYSKLSQPQGEGVRAYHGGRPISQFKKGETVWLSTSKDTAGVNVGDPAKWHHIKSLGGDPESVFPLERAIVNLKKPFIVDAKEAYYYHIKTPKELLKSGYTDLKTVDTDIIADWAKENGYDGIIIKNVVEGKGASNVGDSIAVFDSKNITLSQPQGEEQQLYDEIARQLGINGRSQ